MLQPLANESYIFEKYDLVKKRNNEFSTFQDDFFAETCRDSFLLSAIGDELSRRINSKAHTIVAVDGLAVTIVATVGQQGRYSQLPIALYNNHPIPQSLFDLVKAQPVALVGWDYSKWLFNDAQKRLEYLGARITSSHAVFAPKPQKEDTYSCLIELSR